MKTPEEIKKGLSEPELFCSHCQQSGEPHGCNRPNGSCQAFDNADDAIAYIQQLEAQNAELVRKTEQLQRERDAAVSDLKSIQGWRQLCNRCKNYGRKGFNAKVCIECINGSRWEWRGVPEPPQEE